MTYCEYCKKELIQKPNEKNYVFKRRRFCDRVCIGMSRRINDWTKKNCLHCGEEFRPRNTEGPTSFKGRKYCSNECSIRKSQHLKDCLDRKCKQCGHWLKKSKHKIKKEREKRDKKKIFCDGVCAAIYKKNNPITDSGKDAFELFLYNA